MLPAGPAGCLLILWYPAVVPVTSQALPDPPQDRSHCPALLLPQEPLPLQVPFGKMVFDQAEDRPGRLSGEGLEKDTSFKGLSH